ncbi:MAG: glycosyltransferase [Terrimicrobiaceae bacterium]
MNHRLFFVVNQDPWDGSAHGLYCLRHLRSLAEAAPKSWSVILVCPARTWPDDSGLSEKIELVGLTSLRRGANPFGLHVNAVFHWASWSFLRQNCRPGDVVATASFPRLFSFLASRLLKRNARPKLVYEVHQLECLSRPPGHQKCRMESDALSLADQLLATTGPLEAILQKQFPTKPVTRTGLASEYSPVALRQRRDADPFRVGYFGSVSPEQGIPWLVDAWPLLRKDFPTLELHVFGRARRGEVSPASDPINGIFVLLPVPSQDVPFRCCELDALIIPALDQGHRSAIAFTKAYDYAGLALPIVACDLPTIREVLRPDREALLFGPGSIPELKKCLHRLISDNLLRHRLHDACIERAGEFSWSKRAAHWWKAVTP